LCVGKDTLHTIKAFAVSAKHKRQLGSASFSIPAGKTKTITIKLTSTALKLLSQKHTLAALERVIAHDGQGTSKTTTARITIKLQNKHRSH
jgi:hypothetical protein